LSALFQFEKTIENAIVDFLVANGINAHPGRNVETISRNSVEAIFEYGEQWRNHAKPLVER